MQTITKDSLLKLKSGTDIRGVAVETDNESVELTDEVVIKICTAFSEWHRKKFKTADFKISVGCDSRISSERIKNAAVGAFLCEGAEVYDFGLASTPAMFMSVVMDIKVDAALEITASHHPYQRNGLKFFTGNGGLEGSELSEILELAATAEPSDKKGRLIKYDFMGVYAEYLRSLIISEADNGDYPLTGLKISVDAGNGVGGFYAEKVLKPLGCDVSSSRFLEPDGMFPNHIPNPEDRIAISFAAEMVRSSGSDFGLIFDTDVDRMGCVSSDGNEINRNRLVALASVIALEDNQGGTIVTDSLTSDGLRNFIENTLGGKQLRFKRGYKNVIDKSIELNNNGINSPLAIETSGHAAFKENYFLDDGAYLATKIVILIVKLRKENKSIEDLIRALNEPAESFEVRVPISADDFKSYGETVIEKLKDFSENAEFFTIEKENYEGVRLNTKSGWVLLRLSVHDPILPINAEGDNLEECLASLRKIYAFLSEFDKLDLSGFEKVL